MQIVDAIKNLTVAMKGSGTVADINENQIADCIQYIADNWSTIKKQFKEVDTHFQRQARQLLEESNRQHV